MSGSRSIQVDTGELRRAVQVIDGLCDSYNQNYNGIMTDVDNMSTDWKFDDFSAYKAEIETMIPAFVQMREVIQEFQDFLIQAATSYENVQDTAVQEARNIIKN